MKAAVITVKGREEYLKPLLDIINNEIDSLEIRNILIQGDINFSKSETRKEPCAIYAIEGELDKKELVLLVENCDSIATIQEIKWE